MPETPLFDVPFTLGAQLDELELILEKFELTKKDLRFEFRQIKLP